MTLSVIDHATHRSRHAQGITMRKKEFNAALHRLLILDRAKFNRLYRDHHDADREWIHFQKSPADFYMTAPREVQEGLWAMARC